MNKRAVLYLRVSESDSDTENQRLRLKEVAGRAGWDIVAEYEDEAISGAGGRDKRPAFNTMLEHAVRRKFDVVMVWAVDRLGRSLKHLIETLDELHAVKIDLYIDQQAIDTTTPSGRAMFQMCGVFAEFERGILRERIFAGIRRAREVGTRSGKPIGHPTTDEAIVRAVEADLAAGKTRYRTAIDHGLSDATVRRISSGLHKHSQKGE